MRRLKIAVMNTSKEVTEMLEELFRVEGYETQSLYTYLFKENKVDIDEYIKINKPDVILFDVGIPYEENYKLFLRLSSTMVAKDVPYVLTTTNKNALEKIVGKTNTYELIGKPFDLSEILSAVRNAYAKKHIAKMP